MSATYEFKHSYTFKLGFYIFVLALPLLIMAVVETFAAGAAISVSSADHPAHIVTFIVYFLPGLVMTRKTTDSWWRTLGVGIAYALIAPAYYLGALQFACSFGGHCIAT
jgi:hypothetical protein